MRTRLLIALVALPTLSACEPTLQRIGYDPRGTWTPLDAETWPSRWEYEPDIAGCTDEDLAYFADPLVIDGPSWPEHGGEPVEGTITVGDLTYDVLLRHDAGVGASAQLVDDVVVGDDRSLDNLFFYTNETAVQAVRGDAPSCFLRWALD